MARAPYPEQLMVAMPDVTLVCKRCKGALVFKLPSTDPPFYQCQRCGNDESSGDVTQIGEPFISLNVLRELLKKCSTDSTTIDRVKLGLKLQALVSSIDSQL